MSEPKTQYTLELTKREAQALIDMLYYGISWSRHESPLAREAQAIYFALRDADLDTSNRFSLSASSYMQLAERERV